MVMCAVRSCPTNNSGSEGPKGNCFYSMPNIINRQSQYDKTSRPSFKLSSKRQKLWLARVRREDLSQFPGAISNLRICNLHFVQGKPCMLYDVNNPDWAPSLELGKDCNSVIKPYVAKKSSIRRKLQNHVLQVPHMEEQHFVSEVNIKETEVEPKLEPIEVPEDIVMPRSAGDTVVYRCVVSGCQNSRKLLNGENHTGVAWFSFPNKTPALMAKWRAALQMADQSAPASNDVVCIAHFLPTDIASSPHGRRKTLKPGAVPSVFDRRAAVGPEYLPSIYLQRIDNVMQITDGRVTLPHAVGPIKRRSRKRATGPPRKYTPSKQPGPRFRLTPTPAPAPVPVPAVAPGQKRPRAPRRPASGKRVRKSRSAGQDREDEDLMCSFPEVEVLLEESPAAAPTHRQYQPPASAGASEQQQEAAAGGGGGQIRIKLPASVLDSPKQLFVRRGDLPADLKLSVTGNKKLWIKTSGPNARHLMVTVVDDARPQEGAVPPPPPPLQPPPARPTILTLPKLLSQPLLFLDHATFGHTLRPAVQSPAARGQESGVQPFAISEPRAVFPVRQPVEPSVPPPVVGVADSEAAEGGGDVSLSSSLEAVDHDHSQYSSRFSNSNVLRLEREVSDLTQALASARTEIEVLNSKIALMKTAPTRTAPEPRLHPPYQPLRMVSTRQLYSAVPDQPGGVERVPDTSQHIITLPRLLPTAPTTSTAPTAVTQRVFISNSVILSAQQHRDILARRSQPGSRLLRKSLTAPQLAKTVAACTEEDFEDMMPRFEQVNVPDDFGHHFMADWMESGAVKPERA